MKTVIFYTSETGNTKKYAEDIARAVAGEVYPLKGRKWYKHAEDADCVVFGGHVQAGIIKGIDAFLAEYDRFEGKDIIVFSVGMAMASPEGRKDLITANVLDEYHIRFYQFQGGFDLNKLGFMSRLMMKASLHRMANSPDSSDAEKALAERAKTPIVFYDQAKVDKVVGVINSLSLGVHKA